MLDAGIVEPSISDYLSFSLLVCKKAGSIRFCVNYRKLNQAIIINFYPISRINDAIDSIGQDAKYFTTLQLAMGYHPVSIANKIKHKARFPRAANYFNTQLCRFASPTHWQHFNA